MGPSLRRTARQRHAAQKAAWAGVVGLFAVTVALTLVLPSVAYALDDAVIIDDAIVTHEGDDEVYTGFCVAASSQVNAAALALGYSSADIAAYADTLSNSDTGGNFYRFMSRFRKCTSAESLPMWASGGSADVGGINIPGPFGILIINSYGYVWCGDGTQAMIDAAKSDLQKVLNGQSVGSANEGDYHLISVHDWAPHEHTGALDFDYVAVPNYIYSVLSDYAKSNNHDILVRIGNGYKYVINTVNPDDITWHESNGSRSYVISWNRRFSFLITESNYTTSDISMLNGKKCLIAKNIFPRELNASPVVDGTYPVYTYGWDYPSMGPEMPPDEPDEPQLPATEPDAPEVHEPTTTPTYPQQVTYNEPTYVDADISAILDALNEHCVHIQDAVYTGLSDLYVSLAGYMSGEMYLLRSEMYDEMSWIYDGLNSHDMHTLYGFNSLLNALRNLDTSPDVDLQPVIDAINGLDLPADPVAADLSTLEIYARDIRDNTTPRTLDFTEFFNHFRAIENLLQDILDAVEGLDLPSDPVATDLTALEHQLVDLTESDYQVLTVRGLLHWINYYSQDMDRKLDAIEDYEDGDGNLYVRGYLRELLTDFDNLMLVLEEWPDYPNLSTVETRLQDVLDSLDDFADNFVSYWHEVRQKMDDILRAIEGLPQDSEPLHWPDSPLVPPLETPDGGGDIIGPLETDPNGYPVMPDWTFWTERPEMDALDEAIDELMTKFPFCTLNDLVTIFTRLVRPAQAPNFNIPVPNPSDWSAPYMLHVDLSELDPVAAVMRMGITLWVTVRLARRSIRMWTHDEYVEGDGA